MRKKKTEPIFGECTVFKHRATTVLLRRGNIITLGVSIHNEDEDEYDSDRGTEIALGRAEKRMKKEHNLIKTKKGSRLLKFTSAIQFISLNTKDYDLITNSILNQILHVFNVRCEDRLAQTIGLFEKTKPSKSKFDV